MCPSYHRNASHDCKAVCPQGNKYMNVEIRYIAPNLEPEGSSRWFNIKEVGSLEEKVVDMSVAEGLKLLQASLQSTTVLTAVFLGNAGA
ncbi:hypothetical protein TIFTF001_026402 [Ficus carica]|uniref:Uncharacterized protein n=1 Tax=Ficus carica TaxID=3494 RepID=A0AA88ITC1_FICCA|nr:hypothetical protein TIFTF001_026402 [Ficus carica]